jgi:hypothetical protein
MGPLLMYSGFGCRTVSLTKFIAVKMITDQRNPLAVKKYSPSMEAEELSNAQVWKKKL